MLEAAKLALRITTDAYDAEIASLLMAGANDLRIAGVNLGGEVSFGVDGDTVVDNCTVMDELIKRALITYVRVHFGSPRDYALVKTSYDEQKTQLMHSSGYTDWGDGK